MTDSHGLPPGQRVAPLERFGLPRFAPRLVVPPARPVVTVSGDVRHAAQFELGELMAGLPRHEQRTDINCVTTWCAVDLHWSGVRLRDVVERLAGQVEPHPDARWLRLAGLDGYWTCLRIEDATAGEVLLADRLHGEPLPAAHGAPVRVVAPAHYGYKSVKHLVGVDFLRRYQAGPAGWKGHPRARVAREERSRVLPGAVYRRIWRPMLPVLRRKYRAQDRPEAGTGVS